MTAKITFVGAARNVTGSRYLIENSGSRVLVDCGLYQERQFAERNWDPCVVPPSSLNAILLTHAHIDHSGLLPKIVHDGFHRNVYCTEATSELVQILLKDSAHIQEEDAAYKKRRHEREGRKSQFPEIPLYTVEDAEACTPLFRPVKYNNRIRVSDTIDATFRDAGHVLGSANILLDLAAHHENISLLFSGDVGRFDAPILNDPSICQEADYIVVESTYGDREHDSFESIADKLASIINTTIEAHGNIIVPSFALERAQEILYYLHGLIKQKRIPPIKVFLDSPMAVAITKVFQTHRGIMDQEMQKLFKTTNPFDFPGLSLVESPAQSRDIDNNLQGCMIIAGSGMANGGRIKHHLTMNIARPECTVLFVGYQAVGTLGRQIVDGSPEVRILGEFYPVRARIEQIHGFSAHADREGLLKWLSGLSRPPKHIFVTHGEAEVAQKFAQFLQEKTGWPASAPSYKDSVDLV